MFLLRIAWGSRSSSVSGAFSDDVGGLDASETVLPVLFVFAKYDGRVFAVVVLVAGVLLAPIPELDDSVAAVIGALSPTFAAAAKGREVEVLLVPGCARDGDTTGWLLSTDATTADVDSVAALSELAGGIADMFSNIADVITPWGFGTSLPAADDCCDAAPKPLPNALLEDPLNGLLPTVSAAAGGGVATTAAANDVVFAGAPNAAAVAPKAEGGAAPSEGGLLPPGAPANADVPKAPRGVVAATAVLAGNVASEPKAGAACFAGDFATPNALEDDVDVATGGGTADFGKDPNADPPKALLEAAAAAGGIPSGGTADDDTAVESVVVLRMPSFLVGTPNVNDMLCNILLYRPACSIFPFGFFFLGEDKVARS
jgi:hypothetical protein